MIRITRLTEGSIRPTEPAIAFEPPLEAAQYPTPPHQPLLEHPPTPVRGPFGGRLDAYTVATSPHYPGFLNPAYPARFPGSFGGIR